MPLVNEQYKIKNYANNLVKCGKILMHLKRLSPDIIFLQETHVKREKLCHLKRDWVGEVLGAGQSSKRAGIVVYLIRN